jgi:5'-nucleotidase
MPHAKFEFLSANYDFKNTIMEGQVKPYKIFNKNGIRVGVFGIGIELDGLVDKKMYKETVYNNPVEASGDGPNIKKNRNAT